MKRLALLPLMAGALIPLMLLTLGIQLAGMGRPRIDRHLGRSRQFWHWLIEGWRTDGLLPAA